MPTPLVLRTFGTTSITSGPHVFVPSSGRNFAILLILALRREDKTARKWLQALLFPGVDEYNARHSLRQHIYELRKKNIRIESEGELVWVPVEDLEADYVGLSAREAPSSAQLLQLHGGVLDVICVPASPALQHWIDSQRDTVCQSLRRAVVSALVRERQHANWRAVEVAARALLQIDPLNEEGTLALAECLAASGSKHQALALLDQYSAEIGERPKEFHIPVAIARRRLAAIPNDSGQKARPAFVGRDSEMSELADLLRTALRGKPQACLIWGEPGIGKSRLLNEFATFAALEGPRVVNARMQPQDVHRAMAVFSELVPRLLEMPGALGAEGQSIRALETLTHSRTYPRSAEESPNNYPFEAVVASLDDLLSAIATEVSLVVTIDDVHWLDPLSLRVLGSLVASVDSRRLLLVMTSRSNLPDALSNAYNFSLTRRRLKAVPRDDCQTLLRQLWTDDQLPSDDEIDRSVELSGGNPLFLQTIANLRRREGTLVGASATLASMITRRVEGLPSPSRRLLETICLLNRFSHAQLVVDVVGIDIATLLHELTFLEANGLIVTAGHQILASHPLLAEAALGTASAAALLILHRRAAEALEKCLDTLQDQLGAYAEIANHWLAAGEGPQAVAALKCCASHYERMGRSQEAAHTLYRVCRLETVISERAKSLEACVALAIRGSAWQLAYDASEELGKISGEVRPENELNLLISRWRLGMSMQGEEKRLEAWLEFPPSADARWRAARLLSHIAEDLPDPSLATRAFAIVESHIDRSLESCCEFLLVYHTVHGDPGAAEELAREHVRKWRESGVLERVLFNSISALHTLGHCAEARGLAEELLALDLPIPSTQAFWLESIVVLCRISEGDIQSAAALHLASSARLRKEPTPTMNWSYLGNEAELSYLDLDVSRLRAAIELIRGNYPATSGGRPGFVTQCYELQLFLLTGHMQTRELTLDLEARSKSATIPIIDTQIAIVARGLLAANLRERALTLATEYLNGSRGRGPVAWELAQTIQLLDGSANNALIASLAGSLPQPTRK
ncbi:MAG: hypothetical protein JWO05_3690 [Gemmatimonadetes bacterium]|nr:hypothetical protein [Gemmatimonadota bacterium]